MRLRGVPHSKRLVHFRLSSTPTFIIGALAFAAGCAWVALDATGWYLSQQSIAVFDQQSIQSLVLAYYIVEGLAIAVVACGAYLLYRGIVDRGTSPDTESVISILAEALSSRRDIRIGALAALLYALVYLLVSSVLVFQPGVDFYTAYGVSSPTLSVAACCGSPGTVPALIVYLLPQAHLALQILPLDALFAVVVPILVGLNVTVASHSFRNRVLRANAGWLGSFGVIAGLFTGCPTCAGLFLASAVGGFGATTLAVALAPYQVLFVMLSLPLLLASPYMVVLSSRRTMRAACAVTAETRNARQYDSSEGRLEAGSSA